MIDTGKGVKVQTAKPHLVSLGSGRLSIAITVLPLKEGNSKEHTVHLTIMMVFDIRESLAGIIHEISQENNSVHSLPLTTYIYTSY